ncbi:hypothetical protein [Cryobacterium tepidiphilum]|nr:hypothetical protein [Cryobacterium tepidiphilum]
MSETTTTATDAAPAADGRAILEMVGQPAETTGGCCGGACCAV